MTTGVVLMTYGAPQNEADLPRYLAAVRGGRPAPAELIAEMRRRYARIGGSPLVRIAQAQAAALEASLGEGYVCAAGMRFSDPTIADAAGGLLARGATHLTGVVMSPQWSPTLMGGYVVALETAAAAIGVTWSVAGSWHRNAAFVGSLVDLVREGEPGDAAVIFTAHSLPRRVFEAEPEYVAQLRETAELVAARVPFAPEGWRWAYQSAGHTQEDWLRPDLKDLFPEIANRLKSPAWTLRSRGPAIARSSSFRCSSCQNTSRSCTTSTSPQRMRRARRDSATGASRCPTPGRASFAPSRPSRRRSRPTRRAGH